MLWATISEEEAASHAARIGLLDSTPTGSRTPRQLSKQSSKQVHEDYFFEMENDDTRSPRQQKLASASKAGFAAAASSEAGECAYLPLLADDHWMPRTLSRHLASPACQSLREALFAERAEVQAMLERRHLDLLRLFDADASRLGRATSMPGDQDELPGASLAPVESAFERKLRESQSDPSRCPSRDRHGGSAGQARQEEEPESEQPIVVAPSQKDIYKRLGLAMKDEQEEEVVEGESELQRSLHTHVLNNPLFDGVMGAMIFLNAIVTGIEIEDAKQTGVVPKWIKYCEAGFLAVFVLELSIRMTVWGRRSIHRPFLMFDTFLVLAGVVSFIGTEIDSGATWAKAMGNLTAGRMLRLLRLTSVLKKVEWGADFYKLSTGLLNSARTIMSAFILIALSMYLFACIGVEVCDLPLLAEDPTTADIVELNFGSVPKAFLTLLQFMDADSIGAIYNPIVQLEPWLALYFIPCIFVIGVALMNLVTALIVQTAIDAAANDTEALQIEKKRMVEGLLPDIGRAFRTLDASGDGSLDMEELSSRAILASLPKRLQEVIQAHKLTDMLETLEDTLDDDPDGTVSVNELEFTWAIATVALGEMEHKQVLCYLKKINRDLRAIRFGSEETS